MINGIVYFCKDKTEPIMKKLLALIAIVASLSFVSCTKDEDSGSITVNDATYTNVQATCDDSHNGLWFIFDLGDGIIASALVDDRLALEKTLHYGVEENNGGYGDWLCMAVEYPGGSIYNVEPASGTQTIQKKSDSYTIAVDGKDQNGKVYKVNVTAKVVTVK